MSAPHPVTALLKSLQISRLSWLLSRGQHYLRNYKFLALLSFQLLFIFIYPLVAGHFGEWLLHVVATFAFLGIANLCSRNLRGIFINYSLGLVLALIYSLDYIRYFTDLHFPLDQTLFQWIYDVGFILYFIYLTAIFAYHMLTDKEPDLDTLAGTAAVYLMLGLTWAFVYLNLEDISPGSFQLSNPQASFSFIKWLFYSISTLVSSGYSDVSPVSDYAKCINIMEAIIGSLYIAIVTARIVGLPLEKKVRS